MALDAAGDLWVSSPSYAVGNAVCEFSPSGSQLLTFGRRPGLLRGDVQPGRHRADLPGPATEQQEVNDNPVPVPLAVNEPLPKQ